METARKLVAAVKNGEIGEANAMETIRAEVEVGKFNESMERKHGSYCTAIPPNAAEPESPVEREIREIQEEYSDMEKKIEAAEDFVAYARRKSGLH